MSPTEKVISDEEGQAMKARCMARMLADAIFLNTVKDNNLGEGLGLVIGAIKEQDDFQENFDQHLALCHIFFHYGQMSAKDKLLDLLEGLAKEEKPDAKDQ